MFFKDVSMNSLIILMTNGNKLIVPRLKNKAFIGLLALFLSNRKLLIRAKAQSLLMMTLIKTICTIRIEQG
jgi:hypothetical protein